MIGFTSTFGHSTKRQTAPWSQQSYTLVTCLFGSALTKHYKNENNNKNMNNDKNKNDKNKKNINKTINMKMNILLKIKLNRTISKNISTIIINENIIEIYNDIIENDENNIKKRNKKLLIKLSIIL